MKNLIKYIVLLFPMLMPASAFAQMYGDHMSGWHMYGFGYGGALVWLLIIVVIGLIFFTLSRTITPKQSENSRETPLEIARKRYAGGEISKGEFEEIKRGIQ